MCTIEDDAAVEVGLNLPDTMASNRPASTWGYGYEALRNSKGVFQ
jgi:hypothetical protein